MATMTCQDGRYFGFKLIENGIGDSQFLFFKWFLLVYLFILTNCIELPPDFTVCTTNKFFRSIFPSQVLRARVI